MIADNENDDDFLFIMTLFAAAVGWKAEEGRKGKAG
jgi:hypothetical protein